MRIGSNSDRNIVRYNVFHDLGNDGPWDWDRRAYGIFNENESDYNEFRENIVYNTGEVCFIDGR